MINNAKNDISKYSDDKLIRKHEDAMDLLTYLNGKLNYAKIKNKSKDTILELTKDLDEARDLFRTLESELISRGLG